MSSSWLCDGEHRFARGTLARHLTALRFLCSRVSLIAQRPWRMRACFAVAAVAARSNVSLPIVATTVDQCVRESPGSRVAKQAAAALKRCANGDAMMHAASALAERSARSTEHAVAALLHAHGRAEAEAFLLPHGLDQPHLTESGVINRFNVRRFVGPISRAMEQVPSLPLLAALCDAGGLGRALRVAEHLTEHESTAATAWIATAEYALGAERGAHRRLCSLRHPMWVNFARQRMVQIDLVRGRIGDALSQVQQISSAPRRDRARLLVANHMRRAGDDGQARRLEVRCRRTEAMTWLSLYQAEAALTGHRFEEAGALLKSLRHRVGSRKPQSKVDRVAAPNDWRHPATRVATLALGLAIASRGVLDDVRNSDAAELLACDQALDDAITLARADNDPNAFEYVTGHARQVAGDALRYAAIKKALENLGEVTTTACSPRERALVAGIRAAHDDTAASEPAMSEHRALFDEGLSLSPEARSHRRALVRAAKWCLKQAAERSSQADDRLVAARLRCVSNFGASAGASMLRHAAVATTPNRHLSRLVRVLGEVAPREAASVLSRRYAAILASTTNPLSTFAFVEANGGLDQGFAESWQTLLEDLRQRNLDAHTWWDRFARLWWEEHGEPVPAQCLQLLIASCDQTKRRSAQETYDHVMDQASAVLKRPYPELPMMLQADAAALAVASAIHRGPRLGVAPLSPERWRTLLRSAELYSGQVDRVMVQQFSRRLAGGARVTQALLRGAAPTDEVAEPTKLTDGHQLRFLDKRRDFFAYLRFADTAPCCFNSTSPHYPSMLRWLLGVWRDPLTFCVLIMRRNRAVGFVFGAYAIVEDRPAILLNGVYMRRQRMGVRGAVIHAIEETLCRPLRLTWLGFANLNGGAGSVPSGYQFETKPGHRLRALTTAQGQPVTEIYDDISATVNCATNMDLYWKNLRE